jgi:hypothetical protein
VAAQPANLGGDTSKVIAVFARWHIGAQGFELTQVQKAPSDHRYGPKAAAKI